MCSLDTGVGSNYIVFGVGSGRNRGLVRIECKMFVFYQLTLISGYISPTIL